jgi:hypothetical protein
MSAQKDGRPAHNPSWVQMMSDNATFAQLAAAVVDA